MNEIDGVNLPIKTTLPTQHEISLLKTTKAKHLIAL